VKEQEGFATALRATFRTRSFLLLFSLALVAVCKTSGDGVGINGARRDPSMASSAKATVVVPAYKENPNSEFFSPLFFVL
jgi:hypothetical protein